MPNKKLINILFFIGRLFSPLYGLAMFTRAWLYSTGLKRSCKLNIPVISIGNLTMGGTGKTPMVMHVARLLIRHDKKPAIVSRGYGGRSKKAINIVSKGHHVLMNTAEAGDEPVLLASTLKIPVLTGPQRILTGQYIAKNKMADILLMDDGYQHLALHRDINIALFAAHELLGNGWVFPGGPLREPISALKRAHCFVITGVTNSNKNKVNNFSKKMQQRYPAIPMFKGSYQAQAIINQQNTSQKLDYLKGLPLLAFCGIAKPHSFFDILDANPKISTKLRQIFADHHPYQESDITNLCQKAKKIGCKAMITTEKDMVKLKDIDIQMPIWALQVELILEPEFDTFLLKMLAGK